MPGRVGPRRRGPRRRPAPHRAPRARPRRPAGAARARRRAALAALLDGLPPEVTVALASRTPPAAAGRAHARAAAPRRGRPAPSWRWTTTRAPRCSRSPGSSSTATTSRSCWWPPRGGRPPSRSGRSRSRSAGRRRDAASAATDRLVAEYVRDEILAGLPAPRRRLLLETSVLETLSGPLCDFVLERDGSAAELLELCRAAGPADRAGPLGRALPPSPARSARCSRRSCGASSRCARRSCTAAPATGTAGPATRIVPCGTRSARATSQAAGELVWRSTAPAVSRGDKRDGRGVAEPVHRRRAPRDADARAGLGGARSSRPGQGHLAEHWAQAATAAPRPPPRSRPTPASCTPRSRATGSPGMRDDAASAYELTPDGSPSRATVLPARRAPPRSSRATTRRARRSRRAPTAPR